MVDHVRAASLAATCLVWAWTLPLFAKPPDLPINPPIVCQEEQVPPDIRMTGPHPESVVAQLLEDGQRAYTAGRFDEADALASQALILDPDCALARALAFRTRLQLQSRDHLAAQPIPDLDTLSEEVEQSTPEQAPNPAVTTPDNDQETLLPRLPPIDPKIVDILEKVLAQSDDPLHPKVVIQLEDPAESADPRQDGPSAWPTAASVTEFPSIYEIPTEDEPADEEEDEAVAAPSPALDWNDLLRDVAEALQQGGGTDLDGPGLARWRTTPCDLELGGIQVRWTLNANSLTQSVAVALVPEACGDLRLLQQVHNRNILSWIVAVSGDGIYQAPREDEDLGADEESAIEDDLSPEDLENT